MYRESYPLSNLEDNIVFFLQNFHSLWCDIESASISESDMMSRLPLTPQEVDAVTTGDDPEKWMTKYAKVYFDFYYLTNELIWYSIRKRVARNAFSLADLLFAVVFAHPVFQRYGSGATEGGDNSNANHNYHKHAKLKPWVNELHRFLSFFPTSKSPRQTSLTLSSGVKSLSKIAFRLNQAQLEQLENDSRSQENEGNSSEDEKDAIVTLKKRHSVGS